MYNQFDKSKDPLDANIPPKKDQSVWCTKVQPLNLDQGKEDSDDDCDTPRKLKTIKRDIKGFGGDVTLHGLRYVTDPDNHILRR